jgi:hypothetical protein
MNLDALEKLVMRTIKGENMALIIKWMTQRSAVGAAEYGSFNELAWCVATNAQTTAVPPGTDPYGTNAVRIRR